MSEERTIEPGCATYFFLMVLGCAAVGTCSSVGRIADALEARPAPVDRSAEGGETREAGLGPKDESAVPEGQAPDSSHDTNIGEER